MADLPEATTRQDKYLKYIAENGSFSGGGGGSDIPLPVSVANGGTGATTEADARTNLDVYSKQEVDDKIPAVNVVQTTGTSETDVMSQKAVSTMSTIGEGATNANPSSSVVWGKNANDAYPADYSVVIGYNSSANSSHAVNIGSGATSSHNDAVNIGYNANSTNGGVNIGSTATSDSYLGINLGYGATTSSGAGNINIGSYAQSKGEKNVNIGRLSELNGELNVAIGNQTSLGDPNSEEPTDTITEGTAIGNKATITSNYGVSIGSQANSQAENSIALGYKSVATEENTLSIGYDTTTRRIVNVTDPTNPQDAATKNYVDNAVGSGGGGSVTVVQTTGESETDVMSQKAVTHMYDNVQIGTGSDISTNTTSIAIGHDATANSEDAIAIGATSRSMTDAVSLGNNSTSNAQSVAIGKFSNSELNGVAIGDHAGSYTRSISVGKDSAAIGEMSIAIGGPNGPNEESGYRVTMSQGEGAVALGSGAEAQEEDSVAIGRGSKADEANTVSFGNDTATRRIVNVTDPTNEQDVATKKYVDNSTKNSLYNSPTMESGIDLNTKTTAGFYMVDSTCTSVPTYDSDYSLIVSTIGDTSQSDYPVFQMCIPTKTREDTSGSKHPTMYIRQKYLNVDTWQWTYWLNASVLVQNETGDSYEDTMSQYAITNNFLSKNIDKISIGETSKASGTGGIAIGQSAESYQTGGISIGQYAFCPVPNSIALGANSQATEPNVLSIGSMDETRRIINVTDPTNEQDAATKNYVDPVVLYDNASGTVGTITLSDNYTNYARLQIYFMDNGAYNSTQMYTSSNKICLSNTYLSDESDSYTTYFHSALLSFAENTATFDRNGLSYVRKADDIVTFTISRTSGAGVYVTKIVGYKY